MRAPQTGLLCASVLDVHRRWRKMSRQLRCIERMASIYLLFLRTIHQSPALTSMLVLTSQWQVGTAVAALALGGVAAGFLLWRMVMRKKHPEKKPQHQEAENTGARKELRRKRPDPHTGYCASSPVMSFRFTWEAVIDAFFPAPC